MNGGSGSTVQDFHTLYGLESESDASTFDEKRAVPRGSFCSFQAAEVVESSESIERNAQWLHDQTSRAINGIMTPESVVSDGSSLVLNGDDLDAQSPFDGDLALQQDNGHYYYTYTSGNSPSAASASAGRDDVSIGEHGSHCVADWRDPKLHWLASQKKLAQPQLKSGSSDYPSPSSSSNRQFASWSTSDPLSRTADTPPEVRQRVPPACTDCSAPGANGHTNGRGKTRADVSMFDPLVHPPRAHTNGKPFPARPRPLPTLPSAPSTAGVLHALAGGAAPDEPTSALPEDQRTLSQLRRTAPRQKGHFLHAYLEKLRSVSGWIDVALQMRIVQKLRTLLRVLQPSTRNTSFTPFLDVPDRPHRSRSEPDLELTNNLNIDGLGDKSLTHPNVKCAQ
ncbi:hypothetical protein DFH11DRAFT_1724083 [Phellopilus nigrolimitatus]|nr:hypothetical protein DFH11DRAFT_1724083 [Phellopilus nigrolimitatus]